MSGAAVRVEAPPKLLAEMDLDSPHSYCFLHSFQGAQQAHCLYLEGLSDVRMVRNMTASQTVLATVR